MNNVVYAAFGVEREWEDTLNRTTEGLVAVGAKFGDSEQLMRAKAECVYRLLRRIVEDMPKIEVVAHIPQRLAPDELEMVTDEVKAAALKGIEVAMTHAICRVMESVYDLCTSKLRNESAV